MRSQALIFAVVLAACGGSTPSPIGSGAPDGGDPDGGVVQVPPVPLKAAVYKATTPGNAAALVGPAGPAIDTTLIQDWSGKFMLVLPDYTFIRAAMFVDLAGNLQLADRNAVQIAQDGTVSKTPPTINGTFNGTTLAATINGAAPVSLTATAIDTQPFTISGMWGKYFSTATSTGTWVAITIGREDAITPPDLAGHIHGDIYATQGEMTTGDTSKRIGSYEGTITFGDARSPNTFNIGLGLMDLTGTQQFGTSGFAYFTSGGLVVLTGTLPVNPTGAQFTAVFAKQ